MSPPARRRKTAELSGFRGVPGEWTRVPPWARPAAGEPIHGPYRLATLSSVAPRGAEGRRTPVLFDTEPVQQPLVRAPAAPDADGEVEVHAGAELALELAAGRRADLLDHPAAGADQDALLGLGLDPDQRAHAREVVEALDVVDHHLDGVRDLLKGAAQHLLADQLGQQHRSEERRVGKEGRTRRAAEY